jgi:hypothetical protein
MHQLPIIILGVNSVERYDWVREINEVVSIVPRGKCLYFITIFLNWGILHESVKLNLASLTVLTSEITNS